MNTFTSKSMVCIFISQSDSLICLRVQKRVKKNKKKKKHERERLFLLLIGHLFVEQKMEECF